MLSVYVLLRTVEVSPEGVEWDLPASPHLCFIWGKAAWGWWVRGEVRGESKGVVPASSLVFVTGKSSLMAKCRLFHHLDKARFPGQRCPLRPPASQGIRLPFFVTGTQIPSRLAWCAHGRWLWARAATSMQTSRGCSLVSYSWDTRAPRGGPCARPYGLQYHGGGCQPSSWGVSFHFER